MNRFQKGVVGAATCELLLSTLAYAQSGYYDNGWWYAVNNMMSEAGACDYNADNICDGGSCGSPNAVSETYMQSAVCPSYCIDQYPNPDPNPPQGQGPYWMRTECIEGCVDATYNGTHSPDIWCEVS
jgi:hypothetical protein